MTGRGGANLSSQGAGEVILGQASIGVGSDTRGDLRIARLCPSDFLFPEVE